MTQHNQPGSGASNPEDNIAPGTFEFLITGDIEMTNEEFDRLMTPISYAAEKVLREGWVYFRVEGDEYSYSWEPPGIQMTFNREATFAKAKKIANEVVEKLNTAGKPAELAVLDNATLYRFD